MKPVYLRTTETRLAGAERRLRFLERRSQIPEGADLGGIQFETMNEGGWLSIETTGTTTGGASGDGIRMYADEGDITLIAVVDDVNLSSGDDIELSAGQDILLLAERDANITAQRDVTLYAPSGLIVLAGIPTTNPGVAGALWNNGGVLSIS